jgi:hypothetical protein
VWLQIVFREASMSYSDTSTWLAFEEALKTTYAIEHSSKATRRGFEDLMETPDKGLKVLQVFEEFESRFRMFHTCD